MINSIIILFIIFFVITYLFKLVFSGKKEADKFSKEAVKSYEDYRNTNRRLGALCLTLVVALVAWSSFPGVPIWQILLGMVIAYVICKFMPTKMILNAVIGVGLLYATNFLGGMVGLSMKITTLKLIIALVLGFPGYLICLALSFFGF